jgi:hypothetical protein
LHVKIASGIDFASINKGNSYDDVEDAHQEFIKALGALR